MWIICHFNVLLPPQLISFLRVTVSSYFIVWVLDTVYLFVMIYIILIGYFLTTFLDHIEVWCHWHVAFRGSWLLKMPEIIIVGFLLEFIFVWLNPRSDTHIVSLMPCIWLSFDIILLKYSYKALLINVMTNIFSSTLSNYFS